MTARLWDIGRELHSRVKNFFDAPLEPDASPLELFQAVLDTLERRVQPAGRGSRVFPYDRIAICVAQPGADRDAIVAVFRQLEPRLRERLAELRCEALPSLAIDVNVLTESAEAQPMLSVECSSHDDVLGAPVVSQGHRAMHVAIVKGQCEPTAFTFTEPLVGIGRTAEPVDAHGNVRRNHVAFSDARDGVTETVARAHARIERDSTTGDYHLFNESGSNPTTILRGGRALRVPARDPRGLRLQSGDEVQLGRAVIRVTFE